MPSLNSLHSSQKRKSKSKKPSDSSNLKIIGYCITIFAIVLIFQIFRWQIIFAEKFQGMAQDQYRASRIQVATRGVITAADNTVLAVDEPVWNIYATLSTDEKERELFFLATAYAATPIKERKYVVPVEEVFKDFVKSVKRDLAQGMYDVDDILNLLYFYEDLIGDIDYEDNVLVEDFLLHMELYK